MRDPRHASIRTNIPEVANYTIIYKPQSKMPISNRLYPIKVETEKERDVSVKKKQKCLFLCCIIMLLFYVNLQVDRQAKQFI